MKSWHHLPDIYFLHIPKTAGTSVREVFEELFPVGSVLPVSHLQELEKLPDEAIQNARFASGHFGWRMVERAEALGKHLFVFTFLRDVVGLTISGMRYGAEAPPEEAEALSGTIQENYERVIEGSKSGLMERIAGVEVDYSSGIPAMDPVTEEPFTHIMLRSLAGHGGEAEAVIPANEETLALAKLRLNNLGAFGLVEDMQASIDLLCAALGIPVFPPLPKRNVSTKTFAVSESFKLYTRHHNRFDVQLYEHAKTTLEDRKVELYATALNASEDHLRNYREIARQRFLQTMQSLPMIRSAKISMADGLITEGFGHRFFYEPIQRWLRWAGKHAMIFLPLEPNVELNLKVEIASSMTEAIRDGVSIWINGFEIPLKRNYEVWEDGGYYLVLSTTIPAGIIDPKAQYTAIEFRSPDDVLTTAPDRMGERASIAIAGIHVCIA